MGFIPLGQEKPRGFVPLESEEPKESLLKSTAKGFAKGGATFMPKAFWGGVKVLKDVANQYPAFTPWAAGTQLIPEGYPEKQIAEVEKTAEYLTPEERKGWTKYIPKAAETLGQMAGSAVSTAGVGTLPAMAVGAGINRTLQTQKEGESLPKSLLAGGMSGTAEYVTEKLPIKYLTQIGLPYLKRLAGGLISDVPGEIYETFIEMKSIDEGLLGKKYTPQEYAKAILDTAATSAMTTGIATTAIQPFKEMPPKQPFIPEAEEVVLPPGEKPLIPSVQEPIKQPKGFTPLPQPEIPITRPPRDLLAEQQPLPKPENVEIVKPQPKGFTPIEAAPVVSKEPWQMTFEKIKNSDVQNPLKMEDLLSDIDKKRYPASLNFSVYYNESHAYRGTTKAIPVDEAKRLNIPDKFIIVGKNADYETLRHEAQHIERMARGRSMGMEAEKAAYKKDLFEGKPVPPEVLKDYPELQKQTHTMPSGEVMPGAEHKEMFEPKGGVRQSILSNYIKPSDIPELNFKTKSAKKLQEANQQYINYAKGKFYESYGHGIDEILDIKTKDTGFEYTVKDIKSNEIRKHLTPIGLSRLLIPKTRGGEPSTKLETFGFQSMYEAGEKLVKNTSEYVKAQQEYKKIRKEGGVTEDIPHDIGKFKQFISFPHTIAKRFPKTKIFQDRTYQQVEQFENIIGDLKENLDSYIKNHDNKVDQALIEGYVSPNPKLFSDQELNARGLSQEEIQAYRAVSPTMKAAAKVLEQHLLNIGKDPQEVQAFMADFQESYIPLSRFGKFYVSVKDAKGNGITTPTFDSIGQARKAVVDLKRQYPDAKITMGNVKRLAPEAYEGMPLNVLAFLSQFDENLSANFASVIGKGFPGHLLQVKKTPGFETNLKKSLSDYVLSLARYVSINEYQRDITNMLNFEKSGIVDPKREAGLWGYWKRHSDYIISNPKEFAKFRQFFYYYYLGANVKSALLNATQPLTTTYPVLSKYAKQPAMLMAKAFKLAAHTQKGLMKINPELAYAVQSAIHDGTISEQNINELRGLQQGKSASKIGNALSFLFSSAEKYNRKVSFIAMYTAAKEGYLKNGQPKSHAEMQKMAEDFVKETQYDYRKVDRPELARGWRAPMFTFRMFSGNYLSMLKNLMVEKEFAALARSLGVMLILGGVSAIPGWKELEKALELMGYDPKKSFREYMGKEQGELALHGLPFKTGANISGALGTVELLPGDIQQGVTAGIANLVLGVPTDIPKRFDRARQYLFKLNSPYRAVEAVMPEFVRNPMVAIRWIREEGIRSPKFEKLGTATNKDIFFKAIGIQPSNLTNIYERKHSAIVIKNRLTKNTEEYNFRLARALYGNDIEEYKKTLDGIIRHNQKSKSELDLIIPDKSSIKRQVQGMYDSGIKDIKEMPKRGRRALMELEEVY